MNQSLRPSIGVVDPADSDVAARIVEIQRSAYAVEAELVGFDEIPPLAETVEHVRALTTLQWRGAFDAGRLAGIIAWRMEGGAVDIERLAVDPTYSRRGFGRALVRAVPTNSTAVVSTGSRNIPAVDLYVSEGFRSQGETEIAPGVRMTSFVREASK